MWPGKRYCKPLLWSVNGLQSALTLAKSYALVAPRAKAHKAKLRSDLEARRSATKADATMKEDTMSGNKTATEHEWQTQRDKVLQSWLAARTLLATAKESEMELRKQVQQLLFPNPVKGTQRYDLGGGYSIKLVHKINYTLGNKDLTDKKSGNKIKVQDQVEQVMNAIEKCGNEGPFLVDRLIKTSYDLSISEYGKLDDGSQIKKIIDSILITSDAAPAVEFEEPKVK